ncbi:hypothetical protein [Ralstonia pseudosolanacearum]|uniref:hypothetical protein n=1 Tax=Ralstonia pseudosolanacearum TaxID=1310165 RepID=UPI0004915855|nr:hypothetical protein [Ralstonia pseudosolanacearum]MDO3575099.1 hypothetical protein [Ralstonia pseudosolanacearum]MDO3584983.1 hypothetical protein [Ralstonia pseudosolanacearum]
MDDLDWQNNLPDDSNIEQWRDIAAEIDNGYQMLLEYFDFDAAGLQAYLDRVAQVGALPCSGVQQWAMEELYAEGGIFAELVDTYRLEPELLKDNERVFRSNMVLFSQELLKAKAALKAGLTEKAWWHWSRACFYEGSAQGYFQGARPAEEKRRSGKKGGIAKEANKQQSARDACIDHLKNGRPLGGWMSPKAAIDAVAPKVGDMIRRQGEEIDVHALLYAWLNGDPEVQQAGGFRMRCTKE